MSTTPKVILVTQPMDECTVLCLKATRHDVCQEKVISFPTQIFMFYDFLVFFIFEKLEKE